MSAEVWRIEYTIRTGGSGGGIHQTEHIEGDEAAHTRLMELECDRLADTSKGGSQSRFTVAARATAWLRLRPVDTAAREDWQHVDHLKAWRLIDGEWRVMAWELSEPSIAVGLASEDARG